MKKLVPIVIALVVFFAAMMMIQPPKTAPVLTAGVDMPAGHVIADSDLVAVNLPASILPQDVVTDPSKLVGQTVLVERSAGDMVRAKHLGQPITLAANERAMAVTVKDNSGLAGLLKVGDMVGINAIVTSQDSNENGAFSKAAIEGLKVLYISPEFRAVDHTTDPTPAADQAYVPPTERQTSGTVVLAVPVDNKALVYDFEKNAAGDAEVHNQYRAVNAIELIAALNASGTDDLYLYLMPSKDAQPFTTTGLWVPDLVVRSGATATPTMLPDLIRDLPATPTPLPQQPAKKP